MPPSTPSATRRGRHNDTGATRIPRRPGVGCAPGPSPIPRSINAAEASVTLPSPHRRRLARLLGAWTAWSLVLAGLAAGPRPAQAAAAQEITIAVARSPLTLPLLVAESQGFFAAEGVTVHSLDCLGGQRCLKLLFDGAAQFATVSELPVMFASFERDDFAVVATFVKSPGDVKIVARRSAGIATAADLRGRKVGTVMRTSAHYALDAGLTFLDVDPRRVTRVPLTPEHLVDAFARREVDAVAIWEPQAWQARQAAGPDAVVLPLPRIYAETFDLVGLRPVIASRAEALGGVLRALKRARDHIAGHPREVQALMRQRLQLDEAFVTATWKDFDFRLGLEQSLATSLEAEARWAQREGLVPAGAASPNFLHVTWC